jgi:hypothetical protein
MIDFKKIGRELGTGVTDALHVLLILPRAIGRGVGKLLSVIVRSIGSALTSAYRVVILNPIHAVGRAFQALGSAIHSVFSLPGRAVRASRRGVDRLASAFTSLVGQIVRDIGRALYSVTSLPSRGIRSVGRGVTRLARPLIKGAREVTSPIGKSTAGRAKQQALGEATVTSDHKSHWELLALGGTALLIAASGAIWFAGIRIPTFRGRLPDGTGMSPSVPAGGIPLVPSPQRLLNMLGDLSPQHLMLVVAGAMVALAALVFWVQMVRDSFGREYPSARQRTQWRLITLLLFVPGAAVYFFKVYNHWTAVQFMRHHLVSVMVTAIALLVTTSSYGSLWYFNKKAEAQVTNPDLYRVPNLELDATGRTSLLTRTKYGAPLTPTVAGRVDPFAPIPGETKPVPTPTPSPSPKP